MIAPYKMLCSLNLLDTTYFQYLDLLISVSVLFTEVDCQVFHRDNHKMVFTGIRRGDLYIVDFTKKAQPRTCFIAKSSKGWLWHRRLGHVGMRNLDKLIKGNHILGVNNVIFDKDRLCSACQAGKQVGEGIP